MKIAVIGATGFVGSHVIAEAARRGHSVLALSRGNSPVEYADPAIQSVLLDILDTQALTKVFKQVDAVISAYNSGWQNPNLYADYKKGYESIITAAKASGVGQIIMVGGASSLVLPDGRLVYETIPDEMKPIVKGALELLDEVRRDTSFPWTFLSPAINLTAGERTGRYRLGDDSPVFDDKGESTVTVGDLASALLDEAENPTHINRRFTVGS